MMHVLVEEACWSRYEVNNKGTGDELSWYFHNKHLVSLPGFTPLGRCETLVWLTWQMPHVRNDDDTLLSAPSITVHRSLCIIVAVAFCLAV